MKFNLRVFAIVISVVLAVVLAAAIRNDNKVSAAAADGVEVTTDSGQSVLRADGLGEVYRSGESIGDARLITFPDSPAKVVTWAAGDERHYALSLDGTTIGRSTAADYRIMLRYGEFDPLVSVPEIPYELSARGAGGERTYIVQFVTQPLDEYIRQIVDAGGKILHYLPNHSYLVSMGDDAHSRVTAMPFVRWTGRYEPAYKLEEFLTEHLATNPGGLGSLRYNIMAVERGPERQDRIADAVLGLGGIVHNKIPEGFRIEATLGGEELLRLIQSEDILFIDRWGPPEEDMNIVRDVGGANFIENTTGFTGQGVRAEVMDGGLLTTHTDFQSGLPPILHGSVTTGTGGSTSHGTATYGINFGRGTTNPMGRGMMPEAQGIIAGYPQLSNRYTHTAQLLQDPYFAVYQSNSWGSTLTTQYNTISAEMDDILFINDITILQSQSNAGTQSSRPQAWAKNIVSIGGITHQNTASLTDDRWTSASVGPAADGRLKPELAHFYDNVFTTTSTNNTAYTSGFNGTSAATPITAGHFGLFYQMWHNRLFGNQAGPTVFESRPHMSTAKAVMVNTAIQWDMNIAGTNTTRVRQGFGRADLTNLYNLRNNMVIINERDVLTNLQTRSYFVYVPRVPIHPLKITMVYTDPMGTPGATRARLNDLTLKVTRPDGVVYWGNVGLGVGGGMWSTPGGTANIVDTVENVFLETPLPGRYTIEVIASELVADARPETPGVIDADFALVASGVNPSTARIPPPGFRFY
jgi:hypothetical protein